MMGIYKITNLITGECYIGQSKDIDQRIKEHIQHTKPLISQVIHEVGLENIEVTILEKCSEDQLDEREEYYISLYNSNEFLYGYNQTSGGKHNRGTGNSNCKLTEQDVYNIREAYNNHVPKQEVYEYYKGKISPSYFSNLWEGKSWFNTHYDVYTEENKQYYKSNGSIPKSNTKFTDEEVMYLRKEYVNKTASEVFDLISNRCSFENLKTILNGYSYKHLPYYNKKLKVWVNN